MQAAAAAFLQEAFLPCGELCSRYSSSKDSRSCLDYLEAAPCPSKIDPSPQLIRRIHSATDTRQPEHIDHYSNKQQSNIMPQSCEKAQPWKAGWLARQAEGAEKKAVGGTNHGAAVGEKVILGGHTSGVSITVDPAKK